MLHKELQDPIHIILAKRSIESQVRLLSWCVMGLVGAVFLLGIVILCLFPLKTIEPRYIEFSTNSDVFYKVYPSEMSSDQKELLIRKALRDYVVKRHTVDHLTEVPRFRQVLAMSCEEVVIHFREEFERSSEVFKDVERSVRIISDIALDEGLHEVTFKTIDQGEGVLQEKEWVVILGYIPTEQNLQEEDALLNPLGIQVVSYKWSVRAREGGE